MNQVLIKLEKKLSNIKIEFVKQFYYELHFFYINLKGEHIANIKKVRVNPKKVDLKKKLDLQNKKQVQSKKFTPYEKPNINRILSKVRRGIALTPAELKLYQIYELEYNKEYYRQEYAAKALGRNTALSYARRRKDLIERIEKEILKEDLLD